MKLLRKLLLTVTLCAFFSIVSVFLISYKLIDFSIKDSQVIDSSTVTTKYIVLETVKLALPVTIVIFLSFTLVYLMIRNLIQPVAELLNGVKHISDGDLAYRVKVKSKDEYGDLALAFNEMASKLKGLYQDLDVQVKARTRTLAAKIQELDKEKTKDEAIISSVGDGMLVTNKEGIILLVNPVIEEILGISKDQLRGKSIYEAYKVLSDSDEVVPTQKIPMYYALNNYRRVAENYKYVKANGEKIVISINATPVLLNNEIIGGIEIIRDITKEKEIDRMKTEFISLASHQLRTPLSAMKWFSEMLIAGDAGGLNDEQRMFVQNIYDSNERMISLVNALLNISRIESGRIIIDPKPTNLLELVNGVLTEVNPRFSTKKIKLLLSANENLPKINVDANLIRHVYMNLLTNSLKYTPEGGEISIFISKDNEWIVSQVTDTGYGIPKKEQNRIFQKFYRGENIISVETDGTGLGLYLIKSIVESSGGKIWFSSEENKGTTFWFSLPLAGSTPKKGEVTITS